MNEKLASATSREKPKQTQTQVLFKIAPFQKKQSPFTLLDKDLESKKRLLKIINKSKTSSRPNSPATKEEQFSFVKEANKQDDYEKANEKVRLLAQDAIQDTMKAVNRLNHLSNKTLCITQGSD